MTTLKNIPYLSTDLLAGLDITTHDVIDIIEKLIKGAANSTVWSAPKAVILPPDGRYMMAALAAMDEPSLLAVKTVVLNADNTKRGLPQINGLVTMLDSVTGLPVAILDGNWITAVRTAGLSAVAASRMARKDASVIGFIGCGVQARSHLTAFADLFPLQEVRLFGRGQKNIDALSELASQLNLTATVCTQAEETVASADIVVSSVTLAMDTVPFLDANWLKPGCFAAITDLGLPWTTKALSAFSQIVIDDLRQEATMEKKLAPSGLVTGDLSQLVLGAIQGRRTQDERTAFIFRGHALGDLALSVLAYQKAQEQNIL